jgi:hypothetical protein
VIDGTWQCNCVEREGYVTKQCADSCTGIERSGVLTRCEPSLVPLGSPTGIWGSADWEPAKPLIRLALLAYFPWFPSKNNRSRDFGEKDGYGA